MKRAALTLFVAFAALGAWFLWPRGVPSAPAIEPLAREAPPDAPVAPSAVLQSQSQAGLRSSNPSPAAPPAVQAVPVPAIEPGTIEGLVVRRSGEVETPIGGAQVELWPSGVVPPVEPTPERSPQAVSSSLADGSFRFTQLKPGGFTLRARLHPGPWCQFGTFVSESGPGTRIKLVFGGGRIHGRVRDIDGAPFAACHVQISADQSRASDEVHGASLREFLRTDAGGEFAFEELPADKYYLILSAPGMVAEQAWPGRFTKVQLAEAEDLCLDAGSTLGAAHWRGTVRTRAGEAVQSTGKLGFDSMVLSPLGSPIETHVDVRLAGTGEFDLPLEARVWNVSLALGPGEQPQEPVFSREVPAAGLDADIVLPGSRLTGTVLDASTHQPLDGSRQILQVCASASVHLGRGTMRVGRIDAHGRYTIDMLGAGDWLISSSPWTVATADGGRWLIVHLGESEYEHTLDLEVRKP